MLSRLISVAAAALGMVVAGVIFAPASAHAAGPGIVGGLLGSTESSPVPSTTGEPALGELVGSVVETAAGVTTVETPAAAETSLAGTAGVVAETATGATGETSTTAETSLPWTVGSVLEAATGDTGAAESPIGSAPLTGAVVPIVSSVASEVVAPVASTLAAPVTPLGGNDIEPAIAALGPVAAPAPENSVPSTSNPPAPAASGSSPSTNPIDEQTAVQLPVAVDVGEWAPSPAPVHPVAPRAPGQPGAPTTPRTDSVSPAAAAATLPRFGVTQSSLRPASPSLPSPSTNSSDEGTGAANLQGAPLPSPLPPLGNFLTTFGQSSAASAALVSLVALAALALLGARWNAGALVPHSRSYAPPVPPG